MEISENTKIPLISIIVPVYKSEKYIQTCLDSITAQTNQNFEVILIDDGSPDHCGEICDAYAKKDSRFRVFHQNNLGIAKTRLFGVKEAKGEYIAWIDSDDWASPILTDSLQTCILQTHPDLIIYGFKTHKENRHHVFIPRKQSDENLKKAGIIGDDILLWNLASKKELWNRILIPDEFNYDAEDGCSVIHLFSQAHTIVKIEEVLYFHRKDNYDSISNNKDADKYYAQSYLWHYRMELCRKHYPDAVPYCAARALSNGVKAYAMWSVGQNLTVGTPQIICDILQKSREISFSGRIRDKFLAWCILHKKLRFVQWYGKKKAQKS